MRKATPASDRFWSKVDRSAGPDACWPWMASIARNGYGQFLDDGRLTTTAHRVAYRLTHGAVAADMVVDHLCRNRACVNPDHLEAVTHDENMRRARMTACQRGHAMTPDNVGAKRMCRKCERLRHIARRVRLGISTRIYEDFCACEHPVQWHDTGGCVWADCSCRSVRAVYLDLSITTRWTGSSSVP